MALDRDVGLRRGKARGPHFEKRLRATMVRTLPPGRHTDGAGLYLEVDPSGARRWLLRIVIQGRRRDLGLGSATVVSLAEARAKAFEYRRIARSGGDPTLARTTQPNAVTFASVAREVHATHIRSTSRNGKHTDQWLNTLSTYAFPSIGNRSVSNITRAEIVGVLTPIWLSKQETSRRVLQRMKVVFDWAIVKGHRVEGNPTEGVKLALPKQKKAVEHFAAIPWEDTPELMNELEKVSGIGAVALRFTILTALRSGPVRHATWDEFSDNLTVWNIPAGKMKTGEAFDVPLPFEATKILRDLRGRRTKASPYVFYSPSNPLKPISENTMAKVLKGIRPGMTVHGMRSAFRDWAETFAEASDKVKEFALAHGNPNKTETAYLRTQYWDERENLMAVWGLWATGASGDYQSLLNQYRVERITPDPD